MTTPEADNGARPFPLQSVARALAILEALASHPQGATPKALSAELGLHLSTTYNLLKALVAAGYVARSAETRLFQLGPRIPHLHRAYLAGVRPSPGLLPFVHALQQTTGESAHLSRLRGDDTVAVAVVDGSRPDAIPAGYVGVSMPAYSSAAGRALLAWQRPGWLAAYLARADVAGGGFVATTAEALRTRLEAVRAAGYEVDRGDHWHALVACVAAPVIRPDGSVAEAMSVVMPRARFDRDEAALVAAVTAVARAAGELAAAAPAVDEPDADAAKAAIAAAFAEVTGGRLLD